MNIFAISSSADKLSYKAFILKSASNQGYLFWGLVLSFVSLLLFKYLYPFPDFFSDSYNYIFTASSHLNIGIWPIGYSKFLSILHSITSSDTVLVAFQFFLIQFASLHFLFTIFYFFNTSILTRRMLFIFLFVNPFSLYLSNTVNSDALFAGLSILWFTHLMWISNRPNTFHYTILSSLLFLCFAVRNNAYYYPIVYIITILLTKQSIPKKTFGILLPFLLLVPYVLLTRHAAKKMTGTAQYSLFTGWQLANNALYIYGHLQVDSSSFKTPEAKELNKLSADFFQHINIAKFQSYLNDYTGNFFIRETRSPLKQYWYSHYKEETELSEIITWGQASSKFSPFGQAVILHHPIAYIQYFVYPNLPRYLIPPLSHIGLYNYGGNVIGPIAQSWFNYPTNQIRVVSHHLQGRILSPYPWLFFLLNLLYLGCLITYLSKNKKARIYRIQIIGFSFISLNLAFSLLATTNILRYQFVPMSVILTFTLIQIDMMATKYQKSRQNVTQLRKKYIEPVGQVAFQK